MSMRLEVLLGGWRFVRCLALGYARLAAKSAAGAKTGRACF